MKCEKCGTEYESNFCPQCGSAEEKPKKQKKPVVKKWWFWVLMALATIVTISVISGGGDESSSEGTGTTPTVSSPTDNEIVYEKVDLRTMMDELDDNALKAETKYQNKYIEVTGKISNFDSDGSYISIEPVNADAWNFDNMMCYIKSDQQRQYLLNKSKGDTVTIKGKVKSIGEVLGYSVDIKEVK